MIDPYITFLKRRLQIINDKCTEQGQYYYEIEELIKDIEYY